MSKIEELLSDCNVDITFPQVTSYFLGILCSDKPMLAVRAVNLLLEDYPDANAHLRRYLKEVYERLKRSLSGYLPKMFTVNEDEEIEVFIERAQGQIEYFLMGMNLTGTTADTAMIPGMREALAELENLSEDMDDYLSGEENLDGEELKEAILALWEDFCRFKI